MANNRVVFDGLAELREALRNLPSELAGAATRIVQDAGNRAAGDVRAAYAAHRRSGNLQDNVHVQHQWSGLAVTTTIQSTARHANLFEMGTQARHTAIGANRGSMPPAHAFVPPVIKARRRMYEELKTKLEEEGLVVSGDA